jgi:DNA-binding FrmR family transcriptional regulator
MKSKVVIASTNKKALDAIKKLQDQKKKLQKMMAQDKPISKILSQA